MNFGSPLVALLVAVVLFGVTVPIAGRLARYADDSRLAWLVVGSLVLRLAGSVMQIVVIAHAYGGVADFNGYVHHGAHIAASIRSGHFNLGSDRTLGDEATSVVTGVVFLIVGTNQLAGFMVFSWLAMVGLIAFYLALRTAVPRCDSLRYAVILFLFPSLLFWTSAVGKEAVMTPLLGLGAWGAARVLARRRGGLAMFVIGDGVAAIVRPDEAALLFGAFFLGYMFRRRPGAGPLGLIQKVFVLAACVVVGFFLLRLTASSAHVSHLSFGGISRALKKTHAGNTGTGAGFGSSNYQWSSSPLAYPRDVYTVLFDPLPFQAHSLTQLLAAAENSVLVLVFIASWRRLSQLPRAFLHEPYVVMALAYSAAFLYLFAALGNLGLLDRERTLLFPMLLVIVCLPTRYRAATPEEEEAEGATELTPPRYAMLPAGWR